MDRRDVGEKELREAEKEISAILDKYKIGGAISLVSASMAQFVFKFPSWSLINFEGDILKVRTDVEDPDLTNDSVRLIMGLRDMLGMQFAAMEDVAQKLQEAIEEVGGSITNDDVCP